MILSFWDDQTVLVTGTTGFVGKCLIEKLLRDTKVAKVVTLIRPKKGKSPQQRMLQEVAASPIFDKMRRIHGDHFEEFMNSKVLAVGGDITVDGLGLSPQDAAFVHSNVQEILNCAANVDFNERLDGALTTNCRGPLRLLALAKECRKLRAYVHVSTAYVNCNQPNRTRVMEELPNVHMEPELVLSRIFAPSMTPQQILSDTPQLLGRYPNTYTFTKACGEILLSRAAGKVPCAIVRPTIIGCGWKDPVPGWVDAVSAGGAMYLSGGLGFMPVMPGNGHLIGDQIPVDLVVNTIIAAAADRALSSESRGGHVDGVKIYHSSTSTSNPIAWSRTARAVVSYWRHCPSTKSQMYCRFHFFSNPLLYRLAHTFQVSVPALMLSMYARVSRDPKVQKQAGTMQKVLGRTKLLAETFHHFVNNEWFFDNTNTLEISAKMTENEKQILTLDPSCIFWEQWFNDFQYGLQRWVLKDEVVRRSFAHNLLKGVDGRGDHGLMGGWFLSDLVFALRYKAPQGMYKIPEAKLLRAAVLESAEVREIVGEGQEGQAKVGRMVDKLQGKMSLPSIRFMGWLMRKLFRTMFQVINMSPLDTALLQSLPADAAVVLAPTHRSYLDFVLLSWALFSRDLPLPHIAAGEDFLNLILVTWLFRHSGAFFIPRTVEDPLWRAVVSVYLQELLKHNQWVEFFVEGSRSRTGKVLPPRLGLIRTCVDAVASGAAKEVYVVPAAVSYEACLEISSHVSELTGVRKTKESFSALLRVAPSSLSNNLGAAHLAFGKPLRLSEMIQSDVQGGTVEARTNRVAKEVAYRIGQGMVSGLRVTTTGILAGVLLRKGEAGAKRNAIEAEVAMLRRQMGDRDVEFIYPSNLGKDMDRAYHKMSHLINVVAAGKNKGEEVVSVRATDARAVLEMSFLHNQVVHVFAREAALYMAMHASSQGKAGITDDRVDRQGGWVEREGVREWWEFVREMLLSDALHVHRQDAAQDLDAVIDELRGWGIIDVSETGAFRVRQTPEARAVIGHSYYSVALPLIEAYWGVAEMLPFIARSMPTKAVDLALAIHENLVRLSNASIISGPDAISLATVRGALAFLQRSGVIDRRDSAGRETLSRQGKVSLSEQGGNRLSEVLARLRACRAEAAPAFSVSVLSSAKL